jgi:transcriptional regulator with XRE-family HTH domain
MEQGLDLDSVVRRRIRGLRLARGWTLDALAARCHLSPSNLSRLETGGRRIALDQLVPIAKALGTTLDQLIESADEQDVVIRPLASSDGPVTVWLLSRERAMNGVTVAKMRISPDRPTGPADMVVHPGRDWFTVLSGIAVLRLGDRTLLVAEGEAAEFSTMTPHVVGAQGGSVEILTILDNAGEQSHLHHP